MRWKDSFRRMDGYIDLFGSMHSTTANTFFHWCDSGKYLPSWGRCIRHRLWCLHDCFFEVRGEDMRKGTTPTHIFEIPAEMVGNVKSVEITYSQKRKIVLQKDTYDCTITGNTISVMLTQLDTFKFADDVNVEIQVRISDNGGNTLASDIKCVSCYRCLSDEVLT